MYNKERLDGLSEDYFTEMTPLERTMAFDFLLKRVKTGGSEESVHGLFQANSDRAIAVINDLLSNDVLDGEGLIAAAWNLYRTQKDENLLSIFVRFMSSPHKALREKAAYYVPADNLTDELKSGLQGMIHTETEQLARIHAVDKLLECYGVNEESVGRAKYLNIYRGLHGEDLRTKESICRQLDALTT